MAIGGEWRLLAVVIGLLVRTAFPRTRQKSPCERRAARLAGVWTARCRVAFETVLRGTAERGCAAAPT